MKENVAEFLKFRYEKLKLLKRSARGEVWLAQVRQGGELVIIKRVAAVGLPYDLLRRSEFTLPAKVFYCVEDDTETIIVEEFIQGEHLHKLSEPQAREVLLQMCDGLKELHEQGIIHRDIKPSNLILQGERIRLIDFDAARIYKAGKDEDTNRLGTKGYAPPEQYGEGQTDNRSDIYALGVTMKTLLGDDCGGRLKNILDKCTAYDPNQRFQSVDELKDALTTEYIDEPEQEPRRFALVFMAARVLWFIVSRELHAPLIVLTMIIFLLASSPTLDGGENFQEEVQQSEEPSIVEESSEPEQVKQFTLPEVITPPQSEIILPSIELEEYQPPPRKELDLQLPEVPLLDAPSYEPPINFDRRKSSGRLKTSFYLNDELFNQFEHVGEPTKISRDEWRQTQARLHIVNDTGGVWINPTIKFALGQNWGDGKITETRSLPTLGIGESADFVIPFNLLAVSERANTSTYIQIWLDADDSETDERYWCTWFDIAD